MKSKISKIIPFAGAALVLVPMLAFAQNNGSFTGNFFFSILDFIRRVMSALFPIVSGVLILLFGYELVMFFIKKQSDPKAAEGFKSNMIKAIIALFLWFTVFGIIQTLASSLGLGIGDKVGASQNPGVTF